MVTKVPEGNEIEVPAVGDRPSRLLPQRFLAEVIEPRATELFEHIRDNLRQGGVMEFCAAGTVLTGGGAKLSHIAEIAEQVLHKPSRVASPTPISKLPVQLGEPEFAAVIGAVLYAHRARMARNAPDQGFGAKIKSFFARAAM